jgi:hypothetical protein
MAGDPKWAAAQLEVVLDAGMGLGMGQPPLMPGRVGLLLLFLAASGVGMESLLAITLMPLGAINRYHKP